LKKLEKIGGVSMESKKNETSLIYCLLDWIVESLYDWLISFTLYFCILLFFKFDEKIEYIFYIFLGIIIIENLLEYFKCQKKKETIVKLITILIVILLFFFVIGKNFIDETRNSIILLKSSDFFPLNIIFILIFGIILIFDGISILMDKIKKILILLISKEKVKKFYEK
jgi:hypothetical protein